MLSTATSADEVPMQRVQNNGRPQVLIGEKTSACAVFLTLLLCFGLLNACNKNQDSHTASNAANELESSLRQGSAPILQDSVSLVATMKEPASFRFATYNVSLYRDKAGELANDLEKGNDQAHKIAKVVQTIRPDVLLLNEFDFDAEGRSAQSFIEEYLGVDHGESLRIEYPFHFTAEVNTGVPSGIDLDYDGSSDRWNDNYGFGKHPGQYGMLVLSKFPIRMEKVRTFRKLLWKDMPNAAIPINPDTNENFYSAEAWGVMRISSKSHWDVPIEVDGKTVHFLVCHPTPPVFDGPEDRNGKRNHDEIRLFADYISPDKSGYIADDNGRRGGLDGRYFVIAGDLNADPNDGASYGNAARQLTEHPLVNSSVVPQSSGGVEAGQQQANAEHAGDTAHDTADFDDRSTGNLRADYVLPSRTLNVLDAGVFWPKKSDPQYELVRATDHRLVWIDVRIE